MSNAGCRGAMCTYDGASTAKPGKCTKTGGYISNAEIDSIIKTGSVSKSWYDATVDADFLVYDCKKPLPHLAATGDANHDQQRSGSRT